MYTKSKLTDEDGMEKEILTFGPVSILPEYQRNGYGKMLIEHSMKRAAELGYEAIVILGSPAMMIDEQEAQAFDDSLEKMEKKWMPSQEAFYIMRHSFVE